MPSMTRHRVPFAFRLAAWTFLAPLAGLGTLMALILGLGAALLFLAALIPLLRQFVA